MEIHIMQLYDVANHHLTFPGAGVAQVYHYLLSQGNDVTEIPFVKYVFSKPNFFKRFFNEEYELDNDCLESIYNDLKFDNISTLCVGLNDSETDIFLKKIANLLRYIHSRNPSLKIIIGGFSIRLHVDNGCLFNLLKDGIISCMIYGPRSPVVLQEFIDNPSLDNLKQLDGIIFYDHDKNDIIINKERIESILYSSHATKETMEACFLAFNVSKFSRHPSVFLDNMLMCTNSIGCDRKCAYCMFNDRPLVSKSFDEIKNDFMQKVKVGSRYFLVMENNFGTDKNYMKQFGKFMASINALWHTSLEPSPQFSGDISFFKKMKTDGCFGICFGLDSASQDLLKLYRRAIMPNNVADALRNAHNAGIYTTLNLITGLPGETEQMFEETKEWCESMDKYVDRWNIGEFNFTDTLPMFSEHERYGITIYDKIEHTFAQIPKYRTNQAQSYEDAMQIAKRRTNKLYSILTPDSGYSVTAFDYLKSKEKAELLNSEFSPYFKICVGLGSNQASPEFPLAVTDSNLKFVSYDYFKYLIMEYHRDWIREHNILLIGGEPLIHPKILNFLKLLKDAGIECSIRTNARMLSNNKFCKAIRKLINKILVVDFANNMKDYERISKVEGSWNQSRKGIRNWYSMGGEISHHMPDA